MLIGEKMKKLILCMALLLVGCGSKQEVNVKVLENDTIALDEIKKIVKEDETIQKANVIAVNEELLVAVQMKPWLKYKKAKQEKALKKKMEKLMDKKHLTVSNDFKLFWESGRLIKKDLTEKELLKKIKWLKKIKLEET